MLRRLRDYETFEVWSRDGRNLGRVEDFYFDEDRWTVRYIVVKTGDWLTGHSVLLSPMTVDRLRWDDARIDFRLSADQIKSAPRADLKRPISGEWEEEYAGYYGIPNYWAGPGAWGLWATPAEVEMLMDKPRVPAGGTRAARHLRSIDEVTGYHIHATDGEIGHVDDFMIDDRSWTIRYLMIDTSNWIGGRTVLVAPEWASAIDWTKKQIRVEVTRDEVEQSAEYDPSADIDGQYEERLAESFRHSVKK